jgi:hypothetical protein
VWLNVDVVYNYPAFEYVIEIDWRGCANFECDFRLDILFIHNFTDGDTVLARAVPVHIGRSTQVSGLLICSLAFFCNFVQEVKILDTFSSWSRRATPVLNYQSIVIPIDSLRFTAFGCTSISRTGASYYR